MRSAFGATGRLGSDALLYRFDFGSDSSDNFRHDPWDKFNATPTVSWRIGPHDLFDFRYSLNRNSLSGDGGIPQVTRPDGSIFIPDVPRERRYNTPDDFALSYDQNIRSSYTHSFPNGFGVRNVFAGRLFDDEYWVAESLRTTYPSTVNRTFLYFKHKRRPVGEPDGVHRPLQGRRQPRPAGRLGLSGLLDPHHPRRCGVGGDDADRSLQPGRDHHAAPGVHADALRLHRRHHQRLLRPGSTHPHVEAEGGRRRPVRPHRPRHAQQPGRQRRRNRRRAGQPDLEQEHQPQRPGLSADQPARSLRAIRHLVPPELQSPAGRLHARARVRRAARNRPAGAPVPGSGHDQHGGLPDRQAERHLHPARRRLRAGRQGARRRASRSTPTPGCPRRCGCRSATATRMRPISTIGRRSPPTCRATSVRASRRTPSTRWASTT